MRLSTKLSHRIIDALEANLKSLGFLRWWAPFFSHSYFHDCSIQRNDRSRFSCDSHPRHSSSSLYSSLLIHFSLHHILQFSIGITFPKVLNNDWIIIIIKWIYNSNSSKFVTRTIVQIYRKKILFLIVKKQDILYYNIKFDYTFI